MLDLEQDHYTHDSLEPIGYVKLVYINLSLYASLVQVFPLLWRRWKR